MRPKQLRLAACSLLAVMLCSSGLGRSAAESADLAGKRRWQAPSIESVREQVFEWRSRRSTTSRGARPRPCGKALPRTATDATCWTWSCATLRDRSIRRPGTWSTSARGRARRSRCPTWRGWPTTSVRPSSGTICGCSMARWLVQELLVRRGARSN